MRDLFFYDNRACNCYEKALISASKNWGKDYQLMFIDAWNFEFFEGDYDKFGSHLFWGNWKVSYNIDKYHGIKAECIKKDDFRTQNVDFFKQLGNRFVAINDEFFLADIQGDTYYLYSFKTYSYEKYSLSEVLNMMRKCDVIDKQDEHDDICLSELIDWTRMKNEKKNMFRDMKNFLDAFYFGFDFKAEIAGAKKYDDVPIINNIIEIARGRLLFSEAVRYLGDREKIDCSSVVNDLEIAENKWMMVMSILVKAYYANTFSNDKLRKVHHCFEEILDLEEICYSKIIKL